jgi:hypothetical protein
MTCADVVRAGGYGPADECWTGIGSSHKNGYRVVRISAPRRLSFVHRLSYETHVGEVPDGCVVTHTCGRKDCFNPKHLEAITQSEKIYRAVAVRTTRADIVRAGCYGAPDECWVGLCSLDTGGYSVLGSRGKIVRAHRLSYESQVGPIPSGLDLDHLCRNRACFNYRHLEPVTRRVNLLRGDTIVRRNAAKTHCPVGHEFTEENTRFRGRQRSCLTCQREQDAKRSRADPAARLAGTGQRGG